MDPSGKPKKYAFYFFEIWNIFFDAFRHMF